MVCKIDVSPRVDPSILDIGMRGGGESGMTEPNRCVVAPRLSSKPVQAKKRADGGRRAKLRMRLHERSELYFAVGPSIPKGFAWVGVFGNKYLIGRSALRSVEDVCTAFSLPLASVSRWLAIFELS